MGGSPSEKLTITDPLVNALPQSSTTCTTIGVGHAAGVLKPVPRVVKTGSSLVAAHVGRAAGVACVAGDSGGALGGVAEITRSRLTVCVLPSLKVSFTDPG